MNFLRALVDLRPVDFIDIVLVAVCVYAILAGLRRLRIRALARVLFGLAALYAAAQIFGLRLTVYLIHVSIAAGGIVLVILYREELRGALDRLFAHVTRPFRPADRGDSSQVPPWIKTLVVSLHEMARQKIGALVVLPGRDELSRHLTGGTPLDGRISEALLWSIFDPNSQGHDGAMVIERGRITRFQAHLPLSTDFAQLHQRGTRHAAALGLAERTDAMCLVVSEERGRISIAHDGTLRQIDHDSELQHEVERFVRGAAGESENRAAPWSWERVRPMLTAIVVAYLLWFFLAHESAIEYRSYDVPISFTGLDERFRVESIEPQEVKVILNGPRRGFYFVSPRDVSVQSPLFEYGAGVHELTLTASDVIRPDSLSFSNIFPRQVEVRVTAIPEGDRRHLPPGER